MLLLAFGVFGAGLAAEAASYAVARQAGDLILILNAFALLACAFFVGDAAAKGGLFVAALCGVGVATVYWGLNREFVVWFRVDVIRDKNTDWIGFLNFYSMLGAILNVAAAGAGALGAGATVFQARADEEQH